MFALVVAVAALAQAPEYVAGYKPKLGDKVILARDEPARRVAIAKDAGAAMGFEDIVKDSPDSAYEAVLDGDQLSEIDAGTAAQIVEDVKFLKNPTIFKIRILEGPSKGKTAYTYATFCRKVDPAVARANADRRKKRGPLNKEAIVGEVKEALAKAKPNDANQGLSEKKKLVREAVNPICEKHKADYKEINSLATQSGIFVMLNGQKYDVAGNRIRK
ncbi:MAG: hypothetical protein P4L84_05375 [Isosphaeraceae bacterium]|nr:hypothetical protein [Isosphaeraceae bacterium]